MSIDFLGLHFGNNHIKRLEKAREDPSLFPEIARDMFAKPESFAKAILKSNPHLLSKPAPGKITVRREWANYVHTQVAHPFEICKPASLEELKAVLRDAAKKRHRVRAVGSGHAWSDAALTDGIVIETHALDKVIPLDPGTLHKPSQADELFQVEAGITIKELNNTLDHEGKALINMGGYDGQTIAGVISTSTHGSGLELPSLSGLVEALIVVTAEGEVLQIEKQDGISHPSAFALKYGAERKLCQDDRLFQAFVVGVGSLGVIYAVILRVTTKYWLSEVRIIETWPEVKEKLKLGKILKEHRHVEVLLNPHKVDGQNHCLLTTREKRDKAPETTPSEEAQRLRRLFEHFIASLDSHGAALAWVFNEYPAIAQWLLQEGLKVLEDKEPYVDISYRIFNVGAVNGYDGICAEYGLDLDVHVDATDAILAAAEDAQQDGIYHSSPIALRYVAASPGYLSMQPQPTCMIEIPLFRDVFGTNETLWRYENLLTRKFKARPHWGQLNFMTGSRDMVRQLYPKVDEWIAVFNEFNKDGRFYSTFTDRVGFSSHAPAVAAGAGGGR